MKKLFLALLIVTSSVQAEETVVCKTADAVVSPVGSAISQALVIAGKLEPYLFVFGLLASQTVSEKCKEEASEDD